jgi:hypothetical protein
VNRIALDTLGMPFYSSRHPAGSHGWGNLFDLGNPELIFYEGVWAIIYDFWLRWRLLLILGLGLGALVGSGIYPQRDQPADFTVTAHLVMAPRSPLLEFTVVSLPNPNPKEAVEFIVKIATTLEDKTGEPVEIQNLKMERRNETAWWKSTVLGGVIGVLLVIGGIILWEDARNDVRRWQQVG